MGATGYGPLEADCCCDLIFPFLETAEKTMAKISKKPQKYSAEEIRGLCYFIYTMEKNNFYAWDDFDAVVNNCRTALNYLLDLDDYINSWDSPTKIKNAIKRQIKDIEDLK